MTHAACKVCGRALEGSHLLTPRYDDSGQETFALLLQAYGRCPVHLAELVDSLMDTTRKCSNDIEYFYGLVQRKNVELRKLRAAYAESVEARTRT